MIFLILVYCLSQVTVTALSIPPISTRTPSSSDTCTGLTHCRTIWNIIWSCLVTIFSCTWVAIHPNIRSPKSRKGKTRYQRWVWNPICSFADHRLPLFVCALLVPEYILAWAIRQWFVAGKIERLRPRGELPSSLMGPIITNFVYWTDAGWTQTHGFFVIMGGFHLFERMDIVVPTRCLSHIASIDKELAPTPAHASSISWKDSARSSLNPVQSFQLPGLHDDDMPIHPLSQFDLFRKDYDIYKAFGRRLRTIQPINIDFNSFAMPTEREIKDKSKSDWLAKSLVLAQTTWFVMQCIARGVKGLPVTHLEIVTLAYAVMNFFIYMFWWNKPLNVDHPVRVFNKTPIAHHVSNTEALRIIPEIGRYVIGVQDRGVNLSQETQVPVFWAANCDDDGDTVSAKADFITLAVGILFGGIHCIAWFFAFPTRAELTLWRISSAAIAIIPILMPAGCVLAIGVEKVDDTLGNTIFAWLFMPAVLLGGSLYLVSRSITLALVFTSLRDLPPAAYETVHWTTLVPHI